MWVGCTSGCCFQRDYHNIQAQFRLTAQRLGQLRGRKDAQGQVIGRDISILLQQGNETLARAKAQKLIQDEIMGNVLENLEMQIGVLLDQFPELEGCVHKVITTHRAL
jgi:Regulator of Vps4 activity in the MVB pathway